MPDEVVARLATQVQQVRIEAEEKYAQNLALHMAQEGPIRSNGESVHPPPPTPTPQIAKT